MTTRMGLRGRILLFFVVLALGAVVAVGVGLWFGYHRQGSPDMFNAFVQGAVAAAFGILALTAWMWFLFDTHIARPIEAIASAMRIRASTDIAEDIDPADAPYLGDLAAAASLASARLADARTSLAHAVARETAQLASDKNKLEHLLGDVPPAVLLCTGRHHLVFYNSVAQHVLAGPKVPVCLGRSVFDYLDDGAIRQAHRSLIEAAVPDGVTEFICTSHAGHGRLMGRMRLAHDNDGDTAAYVMTLRDVTGELLAYARRDALLTEVFESAGPAIASLSTRLAAAEDHEQALSIKEIRRDLKSLDATLGDLRTRFDAYRHVEQHEYGSLVGLSLRPAEPLGPVTDQKTRSVVYDFDLLSRMHYDRIADARLDDLTYVVFDTETTGLFPEKGDEIVQIAAVRLVNGKRVKGETFETLVNPQRPIPRAATDVHGVTDAMVANAPGIQDAIRQFHRFVEGAVLVAHNAPFDMEFLKRRERELGIRFVNPVLDTVLLSAVVFGTGESHTLDALAQRLAVPLSEADRHTAMGDAVATAEAFTRLKATLIARGIERFGQVLTEVRRHGRLLKDLNG